MGADYMASSYGCVAFIVSTDATSTSAKQGWRRPVRMLWLAALFGLMLGLSVLFYHQRSDPVQAQAGTGQLTLEGTSGNALNDPESMHLSLSPWGADGTLLTIQLQSVTNQTSYLSLNLTLPQNYFSHCSLQNRLVRCIQLDDGSTLVSWPRGLDNTNPWIERLHKDGSIDYTATWHVALPTPFTVASNSEYVAADLPNVVYLRCSGFPLRCVDDDNTIGLSVYVAIPHADDYTWASGVAPTKSPTGVTWDYNAPPGAAQAVSAVNLHDQQVDNAWLFAAGALLGVAGGAAIGFIQEWFKPGRA